MSTKPESNTKKTKSVSVVAPAAAPVVAPAAAPVVAPAAAPVVAPVAAPVVAPVAKSNNKKTKAEVSVVATPVVATPVVIAPVVATPVVATPVKQSKKAKTEVAPVEVAPVEVAPVEVAVAVQTGGKKKVSTSAKKPANTTKVSKTSAKTDVTPKETKETKKPKEAKEPKAPKEAKEQKAAKAPKAPNAPKTPKTPKTPKAAKAAKVTTDADATELNSEDAENKSIRSFKVLLPGSETYEGRFTGLTPYQAANKALSKYYRVNAEPLMQIVFSIRESSRGSKRSTYTYNGRREKLAVPVQYSIKDGRVIIKNFKNYLLKIKKAKATLESSETPSV